MSKACRKRTLIQKTKTLASSLALLGLSVGAQAASCRIPVADAFAQVAYPALGTGFNSVGPSGIFSQTFAFTANISGYTNSVSMLSDAATYVHAPGPYTKSYAFTGAGPLSNSTINYVDYGQRPGPGTMRYDFATPLTSNDGIVVMDTDLNEVITLEFYDAANTLLSTTGWSTPLIRSVTGSGTLTNNGTSITVVGDTQDTPDATYLIMPTAGTAISRIVLTGRTPSPGSWDIQFVHGDCGINAVNDDFSASVIPQTGGTTASILGNDTLGSSPPVTATPSTVTPSLLANGGIPGLVLNSNGTFTVPASAPPGDHTASYRICDSSPGKPDVCSDATALIRVATPPIDAVNDDFTATPVSPGGGTTPSVLGNDTLAGSPASTGAVAPSIVNNGGITGLTISPSGIFTIAAGTPTGDYTVTYRICDAATPALCDDATALIRIQIPSIDAVNDNFTATPVSTTGGTTPSVLANDTLAGNPASTSSVTASIVSNGGIAGLAFDPAGALTVPANTSAGSYTVTYSICSLASPSVCDAATAIVSVTTSPAAPVPTLSFWGMLLSALGLLALARRQKHSPPK